MKDANMTKSRRRFSSVCTEDTSLQPSLTCRTDGFGLKHTETIPQSINEYNNNNNAADTIISYLIK